MYNNNTLEINKNNNIQSNQNINNQLEINNTDNTDNTDNEGIPILTPLEISSISVEDYYKSNYPEYKIIKFGNQIFIKMGRLITFNFDQNNNYVPKLSIGPHWYLTLILILLILILAFVLYFTIFKQLGIFKKIIFIFFVFTVFFFVFRTALIHPQVVMNKKKTVDNYGFCTFCKCYFNPYNGVEHCDSCGVCVEKMDHHCIWVGKCVAKNNTRSFYAMLVDVGIFYAFIIYCVIMMALDKKKNK